MYSGCGREESDSLRKKKKEHFGKKIELLSKK